MMDRASKLAVHLEMVIWEDLPEGTRLTAKQIEDLMSKATKEQKIRAYERALIKVPRLVPDEMYREPELVPDA